MITIRTTNRCYKQPPPRNLHRPTTKLQSATSRECQKNDESERQRLSRSFVQITKAATPVRVISPGFHENRTEAKNHRQGFCEFARKKRRKVSEKSANDRQTDRQGWKWRGKKKERKGREGIAYRAVAGVVIRANRPLQFEIGRWKWRNGRQRGEKRRKEKKRETREKSEKGGRRRGETREGRDDRGTERESERERCLEC